MVLPLPAVLFTGQITELQMISIKILAPSFSWRILYSTVASYNMLALLSHVSLLF